MQQSGTLTTTEVERALESVLGRPEYAPVDAPLLHRALAAIGAWWSDTVWPALSRILPDPDWSDPAWRITGRVLIVLGALIGAAFLLYLLSLAVTAVRARRRGRRSGPEAASSSSPPTAGEWEAMAASAADRGAWREAALALYQAVVLRLGQAGAVRVDASKTPGDYRREVRRGAADLVPRLDAFLAGFERVAYGRAEPGPEQYGRLRATADALGARG